MTKEEDRKIIEALKAVECEIAQAIGRSNLMTILHSMTLTPEEKLQRCGEIIEETKTAIEKIKSNGTAI